MELPLVGMSLNTMAAKHSENRLKFWGHFEGMSAGMATFLTARSCEAEKPLVMCEIISEGEGALAPFVASVHIKVVEPSNWSRMLGIGMGFPIPY